ncbi:PREDICTED: uncharacterized protein LOC105452376 [Wasmannia auropunctata]|uniref:uncharacterized protein LOC105452376 n=1 Tax=Wasmannia auropunctata TaxID=64793 RepID=UPI0005EF1E30|nr:PREDICTED: uncharacterized protein LOC105452376 [Wasmannia auropunctata]
MAEEGQRLINLVQETGFRTAPRALAEANLNCSVFTRVFRQSEVANYLNDEEKFPADSHILGDAAYEIHQHLLTPFRDNGHLTTVQKNYNYRQSVARVTVERCIGLLKGRMRSLLHCLPMTRVDLMAEYVVACCVIYNICTLSEIEVITVPTPPERARNILQERQNGRIAKRNLIMNTLRV